MTTIQTIALNQLVASKANVRKTGANDGIEELADSIAAIGLRQNLNVRETDNGKFAVVAGSRRMKALKLLAKKGVLEKDYPVPCNLLSAEDDDGEISLAENVMRLAMHPADQFEAFQQQVDGGKSIEDVAARFGVTPAVVERRLKLAKVSPGLIKVFRTGKLTLEHMMAFAVSDDHAQQEEVYKTLPEWSRTPQDIRAALTRETVPLSNALAKFVTADAYVAAGGAVLRDLFDAENEGYMADRSLVLQLANAKLEAAMEGVRAEGWKWVKAEPVREHGTYYQRVYPFREDGENGEEILRYDAEDMARAGAILRIDREGGMTIDRGLVHPDDMKVVAKASKPKAAKDPSSLPNALVRELSAHRTAAIRAAMTGNHQVALAATVYSLALPLFGGHGQDSCLALTLKQTDAESIVTVADECGAHRIMREQAEQWGERIPGEPQAFFAWCLEQPQDVLLDLLAFCAAMSVDATQWSFESSGSDRLAHADALAEALAVDMANEWEPTVEGFYGRITKATMLHVAKEAGATLSIRMSEVKKKDAARHVMKAMKGLGWLPISLRGKAKAEDAQPLAKAA